MSRSPSSRRGAARRSATRAALTLLAFGAVTTAPTLHAQRAEHFAEWSHPVFPAAEYVARRTAALDRLGENEVLLVPSAEGTSAGETFRQLDGFEYFAGLEVSRSLLAIDGRTRRALLFVPRNDPRFENSARPNDFPGRPLAADTMLRTLSGLDGVLVDTELEDFLLGLAQRNAHVLIDAGSAAVPLTAAPSAFAPPTPGQLLAAFLLREHPRLEVGNAYALMATLRMIKSPREITAMREAARATTTAIAQGAARVRPGVDERTLTGAFDGRLPGARCAA